MLPPSLQRGAISRRPENAGRAQLKIGRTTMNRIALVCLAASAALFAGAASAQQAQAPSPAPFIDWEKIQITTTDLGNKTYQLESPSGNITITVGTDRILLVYRTLA